MGRGQRTPPADFVPADLVGVPEGAAHDGGHENRARRPGGEHEQPGHAGLSAPAGRAGNTDPTVIESRGRPPALTIPS